MKNAIQLSMFNVAEVVLSYKSNVPPSQRRKITCSKDANDIFRESWNDSTLEYYEEFKILLMNRSNAVLGLLPVSKGGISGTVTDVRIILQAALKSNASGLIVCHNHPSGNLKPSDSDIRLTSRLKQAAELMDMRLLDHLIITDSGYMSFAHESLL